MNGRMWALARAERRREAMRGRVYYTDPLGWRMVAVVPSLAFRVQWWLRELWLRA